ncbi:arylsulfatase H-like [Oratosquilla oratoria]|uniref:arylsulfatase H-like n=1 Tax=Oratosquilla oratoria TaxID=337810 RepID=UPI003F7584B4
MMLFSCKMKIAILLLGSLTVTSITASSSRRPPNILILIADDLGIGDVGCYGNDTIKTPNIDRLAHEGVRLTHHLSAASLCTPSRGALLTGRYPARYGLVGQENTPPVIVHVASRVGLPESEFTFAEAFKVSGNYATAAVGKWHLGSGCDWWGRDCRGPLKHGFDSFYGLPFTLDNVMKGNFRFWIFPLHQTLYQGLLVTIFACLGTVVILWVRGAKCPSVFLLLISLIVLPLTWFIFTHYRFHTPRWWQVSPWMDDNMNGIVMRDGIVMEQPLVLEGLTQRLVEHSLDLLDEFVEGEKPFLLYHAFTHVHTPMFTTEEFKHVSKHGRYGDNVEEMDWGIGALLNKLDELKITNQTIVYFASDHGGHLEAIGADRQREGGHNGLFKGGKGMGVAEGGIRVPGIFRWPGYLPAGLEVAAPSSLLDVTPTLLELAQLPTLHQLNPNQQEVDGRSLAGLLQGTVNTSPHHVLLHHCRRDIQGLRLVIGEQVYKMYLKYPVWQPGSTQCGWGSSILCGCYGTNVEDLRKHPLLYNLHVDPYEDSPIPPHTEEYQGVTTILQAYLKEWQERVPYPPSMFSNVFDTMLSLWLQPFLQL